MDPKRNQLGIWEDNLVGKMIHNTEEIQFFELCKNAKRMEISPNQSIFSKKSSRYSFTEFLNSNNKFGIIKFDSTTGD
jgi:hypothetical protein